MWVLVGGMHGFLFLLELDAGDDGVECLTGAHGGGRLFVVGLEISGGVDRLALNGDEFFYDFCFTIRKGFGDGGELGLKFGVTGLGGECLGPVERQIEVGTAVINAAEAAGGGLVVEQEFAGRFVECVGEDFCAGVAVDEAQVLE